MLVVDPSAFGDPGVYRARTASSLAALKEVPPAAGVEAVLVPGEPETRSRERRGAAGIPIPGPTWKALSGLAERFEIAGPTTLGG
jgi:LDH2 family malate/lactate/ureidoglycolate dehydrogenase